MGELEGLRALVTGGASGIGLAIATAFQAEGARVAVLDVSASPLADVIHVHADITDDDAVRTAVAEVAEALGGLDILVNNAGIGAQGSVEQSTDDEWHRVLDVNVVGTARVSRAAWPHLRASGHGVIVNTASIASTAGLPQRAVYSASKGAVSALTRAMAADGVPHGIRVNAVNPGTADTPWVAACWTARPTRPPNAPRWKPGSRTGGWSARTRSRRPWCTSRLRAPPRPPGWNSPWTAACRASASAPGRKSHSRKPYVFAAVPPKIASCSLGERSLTSSSAARTTSA